MRIVQKCRATPNRRIAGRYELILVLISAEVPATRQILSHCWSRLVFTRLAGRTHVYNLYRKIHVPNRMQAVLWGAENL